MKTIKVAIIKTIVTILNFHIWCYIVESFLITSSTGTGIGIGTGTLSQSLITTTTTIITAAYNPKDYDIHHNLLDSPGERDSEENEINNNIMATVNINCKQGHGDRNSAQSETSFAVKHSWSKAGIGTCFVLEEQTHGKFQVVFDLGW